MTLVVVYIFLLSNLIYSESFFCTLRPPNRSLPQFAKSSNDGKDNKISKSPNEKNAFSLGQLFQLMTMGYILILT